MSPNEGLLWISRWMSSLRELSPYYTQWTNFAVQRAVFSTEFRLSADLLDPDALLHVSNAEMELGEVLLERLDDDHRIISLIV